MIVLDRRRAGPDLKSLLSLHAERRGDDQYLRQATFRVGRNQHARDARADG